VGFFVIGVMGFFVIGVVGFLAVGILVGSGADGGRVGVGAGPPVTQWLD
jgi:hypothetical protein